MRRILVPLITLAMVLALPRVAEGAELELEAEAGAGFDDNPLALSDEVALARDAGTQGAFTQVALISRLSHQWNRRAGFFLAADGYGRFHPSSLEEADAARGRAEAGLGLVLFDRGVRRFSAALRGSFGLERGTFIDPATGEVYLEGPDPNALVPIPDRFDADVASLHLDLRLRTSQRVLFLLDTRMAREDYSDEYDEIPTIEPLDARSLTLRPGARFTFSSRVRLDLTAEWSVVQYDELSAVEEDASPSEESRQYHVSGLRAGLRFDPSAKWSFTLGFGASERQDLHAGYYDSDGSNAYLAVGWTPAPGTRLTARLAQAIDDFDNATVDTVNGDLRGGDTTRAAAVVEKDFATRMTMFVEGGAVRARNNDPLYTYDRAWGLAGLRFRL